MAGRQLNTNAERLHTRLYLVAQVAGDAGPFARDLAKLIQIADIAAVLVRIETAPATAETVTKLAPSIQAQGAALLVADHADIAAQAGADGAHLAGVSALTAALPILKPGLIAGAGGLRTRHDAMLAGEAGADYVLFGEPGADGGRPPLSAIIDRVSWWAELFEIPCVAYAERLDEIGPLSAAGADFIALGDAVFADPRGATVALLEASERLHATEAMA